MVTRILFWFLSLLSFSSFAANVTDIDQQALIEANKSKWVIVDVRTAEEFQQGHVPNAINIPLSNIIEDTSALNSSKGKPIVLYCRSGYRAGKAAQTLHKNGFENLHHLEGDMQGWIKAGLNVER
jgi:rhodanese-related sulfurtransferase